MTVLSVLPSASAGHGNPSGRGQSPKALVQMRVHCKRHEKATRARANKVKKKECKCTSLGLEVDLKVKRRLTMSRLSNAEQYWREGEDCGHRVARTESIDHLLCPPYPVLRTPYFVLHTESKSPPSTHTILFGTRNAFSQIRGKKNLVQAQSSPTTWERAWFASLSRWTHGVRSALSTTPYSLGTTKLSLRSPLTTAHFQISWSTS